MSEQFFWFATRSAGILTLGTALVSVILGLLLAGRLLGQRPGYPWLLDLHRFTSSISVVFLGLHMFTLWADDYVVFGPKELLIPGQSTTQTAATTWGVIAAWLLAAVQLSSLLRRFLPTQLWRGIHLGAYVVAATGTVHAWQAGSDVLNPIILAAGVGSWVVIVVLSVVRIRDIGAKRRQQAQRRLDLANTRGANTAAMATPSA